MYRSHTCGALSLTDINKTVSLSGWVQKNRKLGKMSFVDLRDRYGITQLTFNEIIDKQLFEYSLTLNREDVIQIEGLVVEREQKNAQLSTGEIEIQVQKLNVLSTSSTPPFTIENETDGGDELRMQYRYLDLRRPSVQEKIILRSKMAVEIRNYMSAQNFLEIETPFLIKSTPEGARDFVVPSRMNEGEFYALPQSPQTFKQLLMVSGFDRYFQIVRCFRDEDLRADRQPEFTQLDCEMSFVTQEDVMNMFEGLTKHMFKTFLNIKLDDFQRVSYKEAIENYGSDKPDLRFDMKFIELNTLLKDKGFAVFDNAELVVAINLKNSASFTRKQLDGLTDFVKQPQIGCKGMVYIKHNEDGSIKSSVDKFFSQAQLSEALAKSNSSKGDLLLILAGEKEQTRTALGKLRLHVADMLNLVNNNEFKPLWVVDFPLLEKIPDTDQWHAMHHPFTSPKKEDEHLLSSEPHKARANAYDLVINGVELGGGSIRIHERALQEKVFEALGFSKQEAYEQFGFLLDAFQYGAPPHGGIAFGFDRWVALFSKCESIRDCIAFPKNNSGKDVMINAPSKLDKTQLNELNIKLSV